MINHKLKYLRRRMAATLLLLVGTYSTAVAQYGETAPIVGTGRVSVRKPADRLRARIPLSARGKTVRKAAESLKEKAAAARLQLETLGADKDSIRMGDVNIDAGVSDTHHRMRMQFGSSISGRASEEDAPIDAMIVVRQYVAADWKLQGEGIELLARSDELRRKIQETSFSDEADQQDELSPEELEVMEEARMFGESDDEDPDKPAIVFLATIAEEEQKKMAADAFARAKKAAAELAAAAGKKPGRMLTIRNGSEMGDVNDWNEYEMQQQFGRTQYKMMQEDMQQRNEERTIQGTDPGGLRFQYFLSVGYELAD